jgi:UDP-2-acetamido-3-amino-2,3-dideoxy-glucuronate N-acetyltransferase
MSIQEQSIGLIGLGNWGKNILRTLHELKALRQACDTSAAVVARHRENFSDVDFTNSVDELINNPDVKAVAIATPAVAHYEIARRALLAGKDVFVEKPIALFSRHARELDQLARDKKKILMVGHLLLYHPAIRKIKELITNGTIGRLQYIYSNRLNLGAIRKEENILWSFAPHDISVLQYLIGENPVDVRCSGSIFLQPGIHDVTLTTLRYPQNVHAHIHVSWLHPFKEHRLVVIGDKSMVVFEDSKFDHKLILYPKGIDWVEGQPRKREGAFQSIDYSTDEPLKQELLHFIECITKRTQPLSDGKNGIKVLEILEQAQSDLENKNPKEPHMSIADEKENQKKYFVHPTATVDEGCEIGERTKIWHYSHVQSGSKIGSGCSIGQNVNVGNNVRIGNFVKIQNNVSVYEGVELEDYVFAGPSMVFTNVLNPRSEFPQRGSEHYHRTLVKYGASIGANATIICGNTIGRFAFVGAGAVVTKDVPEYALVVGSPARVLGWMCRCGTRLKFKGTAAQCTKCGRKYEKKKDLVKCTKDVEVGK